jgi:hypothetical protein
MATEKLERQVQNPSGYGMGIETGLRSEKKECLSGAYLAQKNTYGKWKLRFTKQNTNLRRGPFPGYSRGTRR